MKSFLSIVVLVCSAWSQSGARLQNSASPASASASTGPGSSLSNAVLNVEDASSRKAKALIEQAIQAMGGQAYLNIHDREQQGRGYSLHHGRPSGPGTVFWMFSEFPDKERVELTKERDVTELYVGSRGYEITYKGVHPIEEKDMVDYLRRRRFSLDTILRTWVNDPTVAILYQGYALAAQHSADQVILINSKDESVSLYFDLYTHLPIKKSFEWRDPVDRQKNLEEEVYENYKPIPGGVMVPYNVTRYFNGDMSSQRFFNSVTVNQGLDETMFDPNSGYNPNKPVKKH
ncbi:MAG TPA: hypothetical protein VMD99_06905 [Terriglobales bacterium]|nr:hypothetical protein [Terriglobales bacterium]